MNMTQNKPRIGNPTSSGIVALMSNGVKAGSLGKPFHTYIKKKNWERKLGRSIEKEANPKILTWGSLCEIKVNNDILGIEYKLCSSDTLIHPEIDCWAGSPDGLKFDEGGTVIDIKCPYTLESFCEAVDCIEMVEVNGVWQVAGSKSVFNLRKNHDDGEKYYWQLVSNACITKSRFAELVIYMPFQFELESIRTLASNYDGPDQAKYAWVAFASDSELPHLNNGGFYSNKYIIRFEVPQADKDALTARVIEASKLLIPFHQKIEVENLQY